jgi:hypothetical protein
LWKMAKNYRMIVTNVHKLQHDGQKWPKTTPWWSKMAKN